MLCQLLGKTTDRICNLRQSNLLAVFNSNLWEQILGVRSFDPLGRHVIRFLDLTSTQLLSLVRDLLLGYALYLLFKVLLLEVLELFLVVRDIVLEGCRHCVSPGLSSLD